MKTMFDTKVKTNTEKKHSQDYFSAVINNKIKQVIQV